MHGRDRNTRRSSHNSSAVLPVRFRDDRTSGRQGRPGRRRDARRRARHAVALGEAGATVYCTGRTTRERRSEYDRPETIEETAELVTAAGGTGIAMAVDHLEPDAVEALVEADRRRARPARRAGQRHLGRRAAVRLEQAGVGARPRRRPADAAPGDRHASDHEPLRAAALDPPAGRAGRRDDRRNPRVQHRQLPEPDLLRPGEERGDPAGVRAGRGAGTARMRRCRPDARAGCARR